jgi:hypothetical protein
MRSINSIIKRARGGLLVTFGSVSSSSSTTSGCILLLSLCLAREREEGEVGEEGAVLLAPLCRGF